MKNAKADKNSVKDSNDKGILQSMSDYLSNSIDGLFTDVSNRVTDRVETLESTPLLGNRMSLKKQLPKFLGMMTQYVASGPEDAKEFEEDTKKAIVTAIDSAKETIKSEITGAKDDVTTAIKDHIDKTCADGKNYIDEATDNSTSEDGKGWFDGFWDKSKEYFNDAFDFMTGKDKLDQNGNAIASTNDKIRFFDKPVTYIKSLKENFKSDNSFMGLIKMLFLNFAEFVVKIFFGDDSKPANAKANAAYNPVSASSLAGTTRLVANPVANSNNNAMGIANTLDR